MAQNENTQLKKDEELTGRNLPDGDGTVSDEDVHAIDGKSDKPTGQDHSTENYGETMPTEGVGAIQDGDIIGADVADIGE
jgi:hypothetical protein